MPKAVLHLPTGLSVILDIGGSLCLKTSAECYTVDNSRTTLRPETTGQISERTHILYHGIDRESIMHFLMKTHEGMAIKSTAVGNYG